MNVTFNSIMKNLIAGAIILCIPMFYSHNIAMAESPRIIVISSSSTDQHPNDRIAESIVSILKINGVSSNVELIPLADTARSGKQSWSQILEKNPGLIITVGSDATRAASRNALNIPVIFCDDQTASNITKFIHNDFNGVDLRIPFEKQFEAMKEAFPDKKKIGSIFSRSNRNLSGKAAEIAKKMDMEFLPHEISTIQDVPDTLQRTLGKLVPFHTFATHFSPDSRKVWFCFREKGWGSFDIVSVSLDDMTLRSEINDASHGCWSNGGQYYVYVKSITRELILLNTRDNSVRILADPKVNFYFHCFTPDDKYVITTLPTGDVNESLFRIPVDRGQPERLMDKNERQWLPSCSSDGKWILYTDSRAKRDNFGFFSSTTLHVYNRDTKTSKAVFPDMKANNHTGDFSPDGRQIAFMSNDSGISKVYLADVDANAETDTFNTRNVRQLTYDTSVKHNLNWSPDGNWLTYQKWNVPYILNVNSGEEKRLIEQGIFWMPSEAIAYENSLIKQGVENTMRNECIKRLIPFVSVSERAARAGSVLALDIDYEDIGKQTAELAMRRLSERPLSKRIIESPRSIKYFVNQASAKSLGITFPKSILEKAVLFGTEEYMDLDMFPY